MRETVRKEKASCTGCGACVSMCPKGAITMRTDEEGFLYPVVEDSLCVNCDLCRKLCPVQRELPEHALSAFGAQVDDGALRYASSSGGAFTALARTVLARGGVVFGAVFDETFHVEHIGAFNEDEIAPMRGSKYVQSDATEALGHAVALLSHGVPVLFSGTPCQIAGLRALVGERYGDLLLTLDFVCHGVPSPGVFASYLKGLERERGCRLTAYTFRDKRTGWKDFSASATFEDGSEYTGTQRDEPFLYGFLQNLYLRPSCAQCAGPRGNRHEADLTLADLWGAKNVCPKRDDDTGLSLILVNTPRGRRALDSCKGLKRFAISIDELYQSNPALQKPPVMHANRARFFKRYKKKGFETRRVMKLLAPPGKAQRIAKRALHLPAALAHRVRMRTN